MPGWTIIAIVAIVVWGIVQINRSRAGIVKDVKGNESIGSNADRQALIEAERERDELRERVQVLERIVTDANTPEARETKQLADEIESLRSPDGDRANKPKEDMSE